MAAKNKRLGYRPASSRTHFCRNIACSLFFFAVCAGLSVLSLSLVSALVDIESRLEAWIAAYVLSVMFTVMMIALDAALVMMAWGLFAPFRKLIGVIVRLVSVVYRFLVMVGHGMALVMGVVMVMRLADAPIAALMTALHLGLMFAGYFGVRGMEKTLREESL